MKDKKIDKEKLDDFLEKENQENQEEEIEGQDIEDAKHIEDDKSIVERINKKIITEDGRQLLV